MRKIIWPVIATVSLVLSTYAFILGSKIVERTQNAPAIYITYPEGYVDLPDLPVKSKVKTTTTKTKVRLKKQS